MTDLQKRKYECEITKLKDELSEAKKNERAAQKGAKTNAEVSKIQAKKIWGLTEEKKMLEEILKECLFSINRCKLPPDDPECLGAFEVLERIDDILSKTLKGLTTAGIKVDQT